MTERNDNLSNTPRTQAMYWRQWVWVVSVTLALTALSYRVWAIWWQIPVLLTLIPCLVISIRRESWAVIGLQRGDLRTGLRSLAWTCGIFIPLGILGLTLARHWQWPLPSPTDPMNAPAWIYWALSQLVYIALPEELFFRGYVQGRLHRIWPQRPWRAILISALIFGLGHVLTRGDFLTWLTPLPGALMGWLYWRSQALWVPILFHILCNLTYVLLMSF